MGFCRIDTFVVNLYTIIIAHQMMKFNVRCGVLDEKVEILENRGENDKSEFEWINLHRTVSC